MKITKINSLDELNKSKIGEKISLIDENKQRRYEVAYLGKKGNIYRFIKSNEHLASYKINEIMEFGLNEHSIGFNDGQICLKFGDKYEWIFGISKNHEEYQNLQNILDRNPKRNNQDNIESFLQNKNLFKQPTREDKLKRRLSKAVQKENYELAAQLRDKLKSLQNLK